VARQHDQLLRRSVCAAGQPACPQVSRYTGLSVSDREHPALTGRSGTQRARGAHGSGGGRSHIPNLCVLPAWIRSLISPAAETIPRIFRIMETSAATARTLQGMARVRSGQAPAWPLVSDRSVRSGLQGQARLRVYVGRCLSTCAGCPAGTVALGAGGADTYTQRAIPGSDLFRVRSPPRLGSRASSQVAMPAVLSGSDRDNPRPTTSSGTRGARPAPSDPQLRERPG
jgi:hypothetical protein